mgnify:CR=1 FL=1|jgi:hypothetical protein
MTQALTPFTAKKALPDSDKLFQLQFNIDFDNSLNSAKKTFQQEMRREAFEFKKYGHTVIDEASLALEDAFKALDEIMRTDKSSDKYRRRESDEKLGTTNRFEYFAKKAYLNTKRALPQISKMWLDDKREKFLEIFAALDQFTTNQLLLLIQSKNLINQTLSEREKLDTHLV